MEEKKEIPDAYVNVILEVYPEESSIYIDGKFWGISPEGKQIKNLRLKPGKHTLEIVKPGYKTYKKKLNVSIVKNVALENAHRIVGKNLDAVSQLQKINEQANKLLDELEKDPGLKLKVMA